MSQYANQSASGGPPGPGAPPGTGADADLQIASTYHAGTRIIDTRAEEIPIFLRTIVTEDATHIWRLAPVGDLRSWTSSRVMTMVEAIKYITAWKTWGEVPTTYRLGGPRTVITSPSMMHLAIIFPARQHVIGFVRLDIESGICKIQLVLEPLAQNMGHGTQALGMAIDWAFQKAHLGGLQMNAVQLTSTQDNVRFAHIATDKLKLGTPTSFHDGHNGLLRWEIRHSEWTITPTLGLVRGPRRV